MAAYNSIDSTRQLHPYSDNRFNESTGFITPANSAKKGTSPWIKFGIPVAILVIAGAVVGGIFGSRAGKNSSASASSEEAAASSAASVKAAVGIFATATNSKYMVPIYPTATNTAAYSTPTFNAAADSSHSWPDDTFKPASPNVKTVRQDRPRLIAPAYKWEALPTLIANDPYLAKWNTTIFANATDYYNKDPVAYFLDGPSGILDNAREIKMRIKAFSYAYRMSKDTKWVDRCWRELQNAAGKTEPVFGPVVDKWNSGHFLDVAEFSAAFAIGYDWLHDVWSDTQKADLRDTIVTYGLSFGLTQFATEAGWWKGPGINGNWNCVCNDGLTMAALAILGEDTSGNATSILDLTVASATKACVNGPSTDGTWSETANYWYFGTTGHAEMAASLISATGSDYGLLKTNTNFEKTGDYHMYAFGSTSLFDWGDHGPNKFSATANSMFLYSTSYNRPEFALFQRDRADAADPFSMFWYDPSVSGAFWDGAALDKFFNDDNDQWASMRGSWTDFDSIYVGVKAGQNGNHQTHNDLDAGDFVLDAMGTRWAGEYGSADYRATGYFNSPAQDSDRWKYYRKMTAGQNTILINRANQLVTAAPKILNTGSTGTKQGSSPALTVAKDDTAFWVADLSSAYSSADASSVHRGVRLLNGRKQVLIQDEITASQTIQWRMQTNATIAIADKEATLTLDNQTMKVIILTDGTFTQTAAVRFDTDPATPEGFADQDNSPAKVLIVELAAGTHNLQILFNPQWSDGTSLVTPPSVNLADWSLTSHNS